MKRRIYLVDNAGEISLVKAQSQAAARNYIARLIIDVRYATQDDLVSYLSSGLRVQRASADEETADA